MSRTYITYTIVIILSLVSLYNLVKGFDKMRNAVESYGEFDRIVERKSLVPNTLSQLRYSKQVLDVGDKTKLNIYFWRIMNNNTCSVQHGMRDSCDVCTLLRLSKHYGVEFNQSNELINLCDKARFMENQKTTMRFDQSKLKFSAKECASWNAEIAHYSNALESSKTSIEKETNRQLLDAATGSLTLCTSQDTHTPSSLNLKHMEQRIQDKQREITALRRDVDRAILHLRKSTPSHAMPYL